MTKVFSQNTCQTPDQWIIGKDVDKFRMAARKILVIDDNKDDFDVIEMLLFKEGFELSYAASGNQAIDHLESIQPDVIILDLIMMEMNGLEVCRRIKSDRRFQHIPIIMVTALNADQELVRCLEAGADDFVSKPLNGIKLRARVSSMLRIKQQYDELQSALTLREDITQVIVHDLRNPISRLLIACNMLADMDLPERPAQKVTQIAQAIQELRALVEDILVTAKMESGKLALRFTDVNLGEMAAVVVANFAPLAASRQIQLVYNLPSGDRTIAIDATLIRRVLDILLAHALKLSPKGSKVHLNVEFLEDKNHQVRIVVADEGSAWSAAKRQGIFEKYEIGDIHGDVMDIGLGLSFCKMVVEAHQGNISVSDNQPCGSIFTVEI